jgi:AraC-like DNA-binding protein
VVTQVEPLSVSVPGVRAVRWSSDALHSGMKEYYSIGRVESGLSQWWSGGKVWSMQPGSLKLQQPGDVFRDVARDGPGSLLVIMLPASSVESTTGRLRLQPQLTAGDARGEPFQRLHAAVCAGAERFELDVVLTEAIAALAGVAGASFERTRSVRLALDYLHERLAEVFTLDDLASHAELDKFHLCRAFRRQIGMPPHAYLTQLRIMRAKELLAAGGRPTEVASQVGLYDQSQLNRHFRRIVGTTPGRYAAQARR